MSKQHDPRDRDRWARLRFAIVGPLLVAPPGPGQLHAALLELSAKQWQHPDRAQSVRFLQPVQREMGNAAFMLFDKFVIHAGFL